MKKLMILAISSLAIAACACSDDDDRCTDNFSQCDGDILLTCSPDHRIMETFCPAGCAFDTMGAFCVAEIPIGNNCGTIDDIGQCDGNAAVYCDKGEVVRKQCQNGTVCGETANGYIDCIENHCGDIDDIGVCDGNTAVYCKGGEIQRDACTGNTICAADKDGLINCIENHCGDIDAVGKCDGNTAVYCQGGEIQRDECKDGKVCGYSDADKGYSCINGSSPAGDCGNVNGIGKCDGNVLSFCDDNHKLKTVQCTANEECKLSDKKLDNEFMYECVKIVKNEGSDCGNIDYAGKCDGNKVLFCDNGLYSFMCNDNEVCGKASDGNYNCVEKSSQPEACGDIDAKGDCDGNTAVVCSGGKLVRNECKNGKVCGKRSDGQVDCIDDKPQPNACGDVDEKGKCGDNNDILVCMDGRLETYACTDTEKCDKDNNGNHVCFKKPEVISDSCGRVDDVGKCDGNKVLYCDNSKLIQLTCDDDEVCDKASDGLYYCIPKSEPAVPCGDVTVKGKCDGNKLSYCSDNNLVTEVCSDDEECKLDKDGNYNCIAKEAPVNNCGDVTAAGKCDGNKAIYCDANEIKTDDCGNDKECKEDDNHNFRCVDKAPVNACGDVTAAGKCEDNKAIYCDNNEIKTDDCGNDMVCGNDANGNARCIAPVNACGDVTAVGSCDRNKAIYCDNNEVKTDDCGDDKECGKDDSGNYRCLDKAPVNNCGDVTAAGSCDGNKAIYCDNNEVKTDDCGNDKECKANMDGNFRCLDKK